MHNHILRKGVVIWIITVLLMVYLPQTIPAQDSFEKRYDFPSILHNKISNKDLDAPKHLPLLYRLVLLYYAQKFARGFFWFLISVEYSYNPDDIEIIHPLGILRGVMLMISAETWILFWAIVSNIFGWQWIDY